jgi:hypothetical protein
VLEFPLRAEEDVDSLDPPATRKQDYCVHKSFQAMRDRLPDLIT